MSTFLWAKPTLAVSHGVEVAGHRPDPLPKQGKMATHGCKRRSPLPERLWHKMQRCEDEPRVRHPRLPSNATNLNLKHPGMKGFTGKTRPHRKNDTTGGAREKSPEHKVLRQLALEECESTGIRVRFHQAHQGRCTLRSTPLTRTTSPRNPVPSPREFQEARRVPLRNNLGTPPQSAPPTDPLSGPACAAPLAPSSPKGVHHSRQHPQHTPRACVSGGNVALTHLQPSTETSDPESSHLTRPNSRAVPFASQTDPNKLPPSCVLLSTSVSWLWRRRSHSWRASLKVAHGATPPLHISSKTSSLPPLPPPLWMTPPQPCPSHRGRRLRDAASYSAASSKAAKCAVKKS